MARPRDYHTKWSKSDRDRLIPYDITYMWNLKYDTDEPAYETETESDVENGPWAARMGGGRTEWETGVMMHSMD